MTPELVETYRRMRRGLSAEDALRFARYDIEQGRLRREEMGPVTTSNEGGASSAGPVQRDSALVGAIA